MNRLIWAYYNENDEQKAAWLRELIRQNVIAPGEVDERSIAEIRAEDLRGFRQCHFFAGIGVWSYALRLAGWPDDRPVWTGSCPCPSFSAAGKGGGFNDPRHLWPHWASLVRECRPATIFGEQADDAIGYGWLDLVYVDLEAAAYSVGAAVLGACSVGAPHIRQRLYFGAHAQHAERRTEQQEYGNTYGRNGSGRSGDTSSSAHAAETRREDAREHGGGSSLLSARSVDGSDSPQRGLPMRRSAPGNGGHAAQPNESLFGSHPLRPRLQGHFGDVRDWRGPGWLDPHTARSVAEAGATRGFWADCDWWHARDGKYRPIEPGLFPLAHGAAHRVLKLRGYGDAIVPEVAAEFIQASAEGILAS